MFEFLYNDERFVIISSIVYENFESFSIGCVSLSEDEELFELL